VQRLHLADQLRVLVAACFLDRVVALPVDVRDERGNQLVPAHPDMPVDPPDRQCDLVSAKRPKPRKCVVVVGVGECPVDVEECRRH